MLIRRDIIKLALTTLAGFSGERAFWSAAAGSQPVSGSALVSLCSRLCCPREIGKACRYALTVLDTSPADLAQLILGDISSAGRISDSEIALKQSIRDQSRNDFRDGRIIMVEGWIFSLTEARLYALSELLTNESAGYIELSDRITRPVDPDHRRQADLL